MLRLVPLGEDVTDGDGLLEAEALADAVGDAVGVCGVQLPLDTCSPLFAPAVWLTIAGTQLAGSRV